MMHTGRRSGPGLGHGGRRGGAWEFGESHNCCLRFSLIRTAAVQLHQPSRALSHCRPPAAKPRQHLCYQVRAAALTHPVRRKHRFTIVPYLYLGCPRKVTELLAYKQQFKEIMKKLMNSFLYIKNKAELSKQP